MRTSRRSFLKITTLLGSSMASRSVLSANLNNFFNSFSPSIGICTGIDNAHRLSGMGYSFIEPGVGGFLMPGKPESEFLETLEIAKNLPVPVKACNMFLPGSLKSVGPDAVHDEILEYAGIAFNRARMAGVGIIVFGSGGSRRIPEGFTRSDALRQFTELGRRLAPVASRNNVVIALEPLNRKECNFINSLSDGAEIVNAINHQNYRLLADIYHMEMDGESPGNIIKFGNLISHVHIAEKEGRSAPGTHGEDFSNYFSALAKINYNGGISVESRWEDMVSQAPGALAVIKKHIDQTVR
jgi:sugar phosphate isomerase/epimerase